MNDSTAGAGLHKFNLAHVVVAKVRMFSNNKKIGLVMGTQEPM